MKRKSVLISGAGIAGPTLAYWLRRAGFRPTLVERAPRLRDGGYVIDFWGLGYDIAAQIGLTESLNHFGYHVNELRIVDGDANRIAGFGTATLNELTDGRYVTIRRSDLSRLIFSKIMDQTEIIFGDEITHLAEEVEGVLVHFAKSDKRQFDLVVGADGLHSKVRELAFGAESLFEVGLGYAVAAFETSDYPHREEDAYVMYCLPGRMIGRFTMRDRRTLFLLMLETGGTPLPANLTAQKAFLRDRFAAGHWETKEILHRLESCSDLYFDQVSQIRMPRWSKGRIALTGDAAFCVSLAAGQGSALAMTSAYVLAGELAKSPEDHLGAFCRYEAFLKPFIIGKQRGAERFASAFIPKTRFGLWFRNMVMRCIAIPGLARFSVGRAVADRLVLPDYRWH